MRIPLVSFWNVAFAVLLMIVPLVMFRTRTVMLMRNDIPGLRFPATNVLLVPGIAFGCELRKITCVG